MKKTAATTTTMQKTGSKFSTDSATVNTQRHLTIAILLRVSRGIKTNKKELANERVRWRWDFICLDNEMNEFTRTTWRVRLPICAMNSYGVFVFFISSLLFKLLHAAFVSSTTLPRMMMTYKSAQIQIHTRAQTHRYTHAHTR